MASIGTLSRPSQSAKLGTSVPFFRAPDGLAFEDARYEAFRARTHGRSELHFWTQSRCLVTTAALARRPGFADAGGADWPVVVRKSGGGTVFHGPGVLCVTLLDRQSSPSIEGAYGRICALIIAGLGRLGLTVETGPMPAAPCDGRFNLLIDGRKLAGTAARLSPGRSGVAVLAHAALLVDADACAGVEAVARFEQSLGLSAAYDPRSMTSLAEHVAGLDTAIVARAIRQAYHR